LIGDTGVAIFVWWSVLDGVVSFGMVAGVVGQ